MVKLKKYFGQCRISWLGVVIFAVAAAVFTALINEIDFLEDTSFQDIAIAYECWFLFAIFIVVNCEKWWEASLKCFVFFLISQPLIFLIEVPFETLGWGIFGYYRYWFWITLLTLPGGAVAFLLKKKNWLSVIVLSVATAYLAYMTVYYGWTAVMNFPHHLLSAVFCAALAVFLVFVLLDRRAHRTAALVFAAALVVVFAFVLAPERSYELYLGDGSWTCEIDDGSVASVELDGGRAAVRAEGIGTTEVTFTDEAGVERCFYVTVTSGGIFVSELS